MYILYKVKVWIRTDIEAGTPVSKVLREIEKIPSGRVDFIEDENYLTSTEEFILPDQEATMKIFSESDELIYTNKEN